MTDLERYVAEMQDAPLPAVTPRSVSLPNIPRKADVVIGMRRSGKTFLLYEEMRRLLAAGVDRRHILYVNFEDDRLEPIGPRLPGELLEAFYRHNPSAREAESYLFFDEIQLVENWSRFTRRILDTEQARLYLSGSSAKLLSTDVATEFRGRGFSVEVLPFSFAEALLHKGLELPTQLPGARARSRLEAEFSSYLRVGGFPEVQRTDELTRLKVLQDYVDLVLLKDIVERHSVTNVHAARAFARSLLQSSGRLFSVNKTYNDLKSRGTGVGKDLLHALLDHFADAFLVFTVPVFRKSLRARQTNPRKVYAIDPGLAHAVSHVSSEDLGQRLETAVYLELRRRTAIGRDGAISYYLTSEGREIDFVVGDPEFETASALFQVCADLGTPKARARELAALEEAMRELGLASATLVTLHESETLQMAQGTIHVVPAWQWFIGLG